MAKLQHNIEKVLAFDVHCLRAKVPIIRYIENKKVISG